MGMRPLLRTAAAATLTLGLGGCGTLQALGNLEDGAGTEAWTMWNRWVDSRGDIAAATTWERKVRPGVTVAQIEQSMASIAAEMNLRSVGELSPSGGPDGSGAPQRLLRVYSYCNPSTAREMVAFSPHMAAYLPCRITLMEREDGLWMYTLNMDMMVRMGRKLPEPLKTRALQVREAVWLMMERASQGDF